MEINGGNRQHHQQTHHITQQKRPQTVTNGNGREQWTKLPEPSTNGHDVSSVSL